MSVENVNVTGCLFKTQLHIVRLLLFSNLIQYIYLNIVKSHTSSPRISVKLRHIVRVFTLNYVKQSAYFRIKFFTAAYSQRATSNKPCILSRHILRVPYTVKYNVTQTVHLKMQFSVRQLPYVSIGRQLSYVHTNRWSSIQNEDCSSLGKRAQQSGVTYVTRILYLPVVVFVFYISHMTTKNKTR